MGRGLGVMRNRVIRNVLTNTLLSDDMNCLHCHEPFDLENALAKSPFSWPYMATFWHLCESCGHGNHINVLEKGYGQIKILGAPGPNWAQVTFFPCDSIRFRKDPEFLHVWVGGKHFEVVARK